MRFIGAGLLMIWVLTGSIILVSLPKIAGVVCNENCEAAEQVTSIVGGRAGEVKAQLSFMELEKGEQIFTSAEISHLYDVSRLLFVVKALWIFSSLSLILMEAEFLHESAFRIFKTSLILMAVIGMVAVFKWETFFVSFHQLFFPQGNWAFPRDSNLLKIFPEQYWQKMAGLTLTVMVILAGVLLVINRIKSKNAKE